MGLRGGRRRLGRLGVRRRAAGVRQAGGRARLPRPAVNLEPARDRPNLTVRGGGQVDTLVVEPAGLRVAGVRLASGERCLLREGGEVVLCCGAVHTPAILMRSGIGPASDLAGLSHRAFAPVLDGSPALPEPEELPRVVTDTVHVCSTCRMGTAGDPAAVVAPDGPVRGARGLRVVDASIT